MKKLLLFLFILIGIKPYPDYKQLLTQFHIEQVGEDSVNQFHRVFPFIVSNDYVYLAYLQDKYNGRNPEKIIKLIRYGKTGSKKRILY